MFFVNFHRFYFHYATYSIFPRLRAGCPPCGAVWPCPHTAGVPRLLAWCFGCAHTPHPHGACPHLWGLCPQRPRCCGGFPQGGSAPPVAGTPPPGALMSRPSPRISLFCSATAPQKSFFCPTEFKTIVYSSRSGRLRVRGGSRPASLLSLSITPLGAVALHNWQGKACQCKATARKGYLY